MLGERVLPDAERQLALELRRAAVEHEVPALAGALAELVEQPRLADPALAGERDHRAAGGARAARARRPPPRAPRAARGVFRCGGHCRQI